MFLISMTWMRPSVPTTMKSGVNTLGVPPWRTVVSISASGEDCVQ